MTFAQKIKSLRVERKLSLGDVAANTKNIVQRASVWKVEKSINIPKIDTLRTLCFKGLGLKEKSPEWDEVYALWVAARSKTPITTQELATQMSKTFLKNNRELEALIRAAGKLTPDQFDELMKAIKRPAVLEGIRGLNAVYEAGGK